MPTCVLLSRRFIEMLSRVSRIHVSRAEGARVTRREPGTWELKTLDLVLPPNSIAEVSLISFFERRLRLLFATQRCFVKDNSLRKTYFYQSSFPIQIFVQDYFIYTLKKERRKEIRVQVTCVRFCFMGIYETASADRFVVAFRNYLLSSHRNRLLSLTSSVRLGEPRAFF